MTQNKFFLISKSDTLEIRQALEGAMVWCPEPLALQQLRNALLSLDSGLYLTDEVPEDFEYEEGDRTNA